MVKLTVFCGPMFAGKTSRLIESWNSCETDKLAFKYIKDTRYDTENIAIVNHDRVKIPAIPISKCSEIYNYITDHTQLSDPIEIIGSKRKAKLDTVDDIDSVTNLEANLEANLADTSKGITIIIDEGQFYPDIYDWFIEIRTNPQLNKLINHVFVSGLDYDIFGKIFSDQFTKLCDIACECNTISAKCSVCNMPAYRTQFIDNTHTDSLEGNVFIGGESEFQPVCISHFIPLNSNIRQTSF